MAGQIVSDGGIAVLPLFRSLAWFLCKASCAALLGGAILWEVAIHCGPPRGTIYVHVSGGYGDLEVDDATYRVRSLLESPVVCELEPGRHSMRMLRDGAVVFEDEFSLDPGEEIVMTAGERTRTEHETR
jgi:hypothetical protein